MMMNYLKQTSTCTAQQHYSNYSVLQMNNVYAVVIKVQHAVSCSIFDLHYQNQYQRLKSDTDTKNLLFCYRHVNGSILLCKMPQWTAHSIIDTVLNFILPQTACVLEAVVNQSHITWNGRMVIGYEKNFFS